MKTVISAIFLILAVVLSGCDVYTTLYGTQNQTAVYVPDSSIVIAEEPSLETAPSDASESLEDAALTAEQQAIADSLTQKIEQKSAEEAISTETATETLEETQETQVPSIIETAEEIAPIELEEVSSDASVESEESSDPESAEPLALIAQETEKISLSPNAVDPDGDSLIFAFTTPLDENGEWQTSYGDAGEYTATITASDGDLATTRDILLIINKKEESPTIDSSSPQDAAISLTETEAQSFGITASDLNKDPLTYTWKLDGTDVSDKRTFDYQSGYDDAGSHTIKVDVTDGISTVSKIWGIDVANLNRKPTLKALSDIVTKENEIITIHPEATDEDQDALTYTISDPRFALKDGAFVWQTTYESAGAYPITLTVSDGTESVSQSMKITVQNVNRKPVIVDITKK